MTAGQVQWRIDTSVRWGERAAPMMQHPLDMGAHYYPPGVHPDHRTHRYRSFMIEEILTDHPDQKVSAPAGELLKFGVHALLSARPLHSQLGKKRRELTSCSHFFIITFLEEEKYVSFWNENESLRIYQRRRGWGVHWSICVERRNVQSFRGKLNAEQTE